MLSNNMIDSDAAVSAAGLAADSARSYADNGRRHESQDVSILVNFSNPP